MPLSNPVADVSQNVLTMPTKVITVDLNGNYEGGGTAASPSYVRIQDGVTTTNVATVSQFHNADHQNPGGTAYGILTGGVAQLLTPDGFIDRQRETGVDQVSNLGIVMGSQMFAQFFKTTVPTTGTITSGQASATITPASMTGIQVGAALTVTSGANSEVVVVTALPSGTTATVVPTNGAPSAPTFKNTYTPSYTVTGFLFNQERDASGENSGASGKGTAVAAEYEYVSGGPPLANGTPSLLQYDREVAALGKVAANAGAGFAITSTTAGNTSLTPTTPANFAQLTPGQWIRLSGSGTNEYVRVDETYTISATPASIPLSSPVVNNSQTTATFDTFGANGPGTNPVLWTGEGFEGVLLNDVTQPGFARAWQGDASGSARVVLQGSSNAVIGTNTQAVNTACNSTLPAVAGKTNYVTGISVHTQGGSAAAAGAVTLGNLVGGVTLNFAVGAAANNPVQFDITFPSPIPANAANLVTTLTVPALGANTGAVTSNIYGFTQ